MEEQNTEQNMIGNYYIGAQKSIAHISKRMLYGESLSKLHRIRIKFPTHVNMLLIFGSFIK